MANILTDPPATYAATTVLTTKANNTPRVDSDAAQWVIAQWGNEVDSALKALNAWLRGSSSAGAASTTVSLLGNLSLAGQITANGAFSNFGSVSSASSRITLRATNTGQSGYYFGDSDSSVIASLYYFHSSDTMRINVGGTAMVDITSSAMFPVSHNTKDLGKAANRWREAYIDKLFAVTEATFGNGGDIAVTIDGSSTGGNEPKLYYAHGGTPVVLMQAGTDADGNLFEGFIQGKFSFEHSWSLIVSNADTATRTGLANDTGALTFDIDTNTLWMNDGSAWYELSNMPIVTLSVANGTRDVTNGATLGEAGTGVPVYFFGPSGDQNASWYFTVPNTYRGGNLDLKLWWSGTTSVAGISMWEVGFQRIVAGKPLTVDQRTLSSFNLTAPANIFDVNLVTLTLSNASMDGMQPGDLVRLSIMRDGDAGVDTYTGSIGVIGMQLVQG